MGQGAGPEAWRRAEGVVPPDTRTPGEIADQVVRETGSIWAKAEWEFQMASREFLEAAVIRGQPQGILTADLEAGRQSMARRIPDGVTGTIPPWESPVNPRAP